MCYTLTKPLRHTLPLSSCIWQATNVWQSYHSCWSAQDRMVWCLNVGKVGGWKAIQLNENCSQWIFFQVLIRKSKYFWGIFCQTLPTHFLFKSHSCIIRKPLSHCINLECTSQTHQTDPSGKLLSNKVKICLRDLALKTFELGNVLLRRNLLQ